MQPIVGLLRRLGRSARSLLGGASPAAQILGMRFFWKNASLAPRRSGFDPRRLHFLCARSESADTRIPIARIPEAGCFAARSRCPSHRTCLRSVNGKHAPFVRPRCGFNSCRRLLRTPVAQRPRALPCEGRGRWFDSSRAYPRGRSSSGTEHRSATPERPVRAGPSALVDSWCNGSTPSSNLGDPGSNPGESAARPRRGPKRVGYLMDRRA